MGGRRLLQRTAPAAAAAALAALAAAAVVWAAGGGGAATSQANGFAGPVTQSARPIERVLGPAPRGKLLRVACAGAARTTACWVAAR